MVEGTPTHVLRRIKIDGSAPGSLASRAIQMAGIKSFPVPTDTLHAIGAECFGVATREEGQLPLAVDLSSENPSISAQTPHNMRYDAALTIGGTLFLNRQDYRAELFARSLLLPESMVKKFVDDSHERPDLSVRKLAQLALIADVPMHAVIRRLGDIRNHGLNPKDVTVGFSDEQTPNDKGFICTNRGLTHDATRVAENTQKILKERDYSTPILNVLAVRTEYDGTQSAYSVTLRLPYDYAHFERPTGEKETLLQFHLGNKITGLPSRIQDGGSLWNDITLINIE